MPEETEVRSREPMAVSLDLELLTLKNATRGAEILADYQTRQGFMDEESEEDAPVAVFSILSLVGSRLEQLRRVIRGEENPEHIWGPQNAISLPDSLDAIDGDIVLFAWNSPGLPLVIARPSGWGVDPEELRERKALGRNLEGRKAKGPKGRKAKEPAPAAQQEEPAQESPSVPGEESNEPPPAAS
jgi:hypothetical protein